MMEAAVINVGISITGALLAVGGAWGLMRTGITANTKAIGELKLTNGEQWKKINETNVTVARIDANVTTLLERKKS